MNHFKEPKFVMRKPRKTLLKLINSMNEFKRFWSEVKYAFECILQGKEDYLDKDKK